MKWECSSTRESTCLKSMVLGENSKNSPNSKDTKISEILPIPTISLDTKDATFSYNDVNRKITIPNKLDVFLAEDIGIQIGDGSIPLYIDKK